MNERGQWWGEFEGRVCFVIVLCPEGFFGIDWIFFKSVLCCAEL